MKKLYINKRVEAWLMEKLEDEIRYLELAIKKHIFSKRYEANRKKLLNDLKRVRERLIKQGDNK